VENLNTYVYVRQGAFRWFKSIIAKDKLFTYLRIIFLYSFYFVVLMKIIRNQRTSFYVHFSHIDTMFYDHQYLILKRMLCVN